MSKQLAAGVRMTLTVPPKTTVGAVFQASWRVAKRFPADTPAYLVVAVSGDARFEVDFPPRDANAPLGETFPGERSAMPGFLALTPTAPGPYNIKAGEGSTRVMIPLNLEETPLSGTFSGYHLSAGEQVVRASIVAKSACGEMEIASLSRQTTTVAPGPAQIVVQDLYQSETPLRAVVSSSGRYLLHAFPNRYHVYDTVSGAKIIDRAGHDPNFSPTSRFVAAEIGDQDGSEFEVIDLASQRLVAKPMGPYIGWLYGDSYIFDGADWHGLRVRAALVSRPGDPERWWNVEDLCRRDSAEASRRDDELWLAVIIDQIVCGGKSGRAASNNVAIDLEGRCGQVIATGTWPGSDATKCPFPEPRSDSKRKSWQSTDPLRFSHVSKRSLERDAAEADPLIKEEVRHELELRGKLLAHREIATDTGIRQMASMLSSDITVRGEWSAGRRSSDESVASSVRRLLTELAKFGVQTAPLVPREEVSYARAELVANPSYEQQLYEQQFGTTEEDAERIINRLLGEVPAIAPSFAPQQEGDDNYPREGATRPIRIGEAIMGLWRWEVDGRPLWLLQLLRIEGSGGFGQPAIILLDGTPGANRIVNITDALTKVWSGTFGMTPQITRLKPQLLGGRYLVIGSAAERTIGIFDVRKNALLSVVREIPQASLLQDIAVSPDRQRIVQINSDGQFFIHHAASGELSVSGRFLDGEVVLYTREGYYWSTYEGAHFVQLRFPGLDGLFQFNQFASALNREDHVKAKLKDAHHKLPAPELAPPPTVSLEAVVTPERTLKAVRVSAISATGLARLRVFRDGQPIQERAIAGQNYSAEIDLQDASQARQISVLAVDTKGFVSVPQALHFKPNKAAENKLHAVLVGIDTYIDPALALRYATSDARRLEKALEVGDGPYYASRDITVLVDKQVTVASVTAALEKAVSRAKPKDTILFSFAGHGLPGKDGKYYLTNSEFDLKNTERTGLPWAAVAGILGRSKARVVVIIDSCHAGLSGSQGLASNDAAAAELLSGKRAPMIVLAAAKGRESSYEHDRWGGGVFTDALTRILATERDKFDKDKDSTISVSELYRGLREILLRETSGAQTPWLARQDLIGDFPLF